MSRRRHSGGGAPAGRKEKSLDLPGDERVIGQHTYRVAMLPMGKWLELEAILLDVIGPALAELIGGWRSGEGIGGLDHRALAFAISAISTKAPAETQGRVLDILSASTLCDGHRLNSLHWPRNMGELAAYVAFALEVQFADFFGGLAAELSALEEAPPDAEEEQQSPRD